MNHMTLALLLFLAGAAQGGPGTVTGELKKWHRVTVTFDGPATSEGAAANPFRDYRLDVTFTRGSKSITVPGFYAADGNAGESSASSGNKWRVHFVPDEEGSWTYTASFKTGADVAVNGGGATTSFHGATGSFAVGPTDKTGRDHRAKGRLRYAGSHYAQFAQTGEYFIKGGADSPENFLAFVDFDQTPAKHSYAPHAGDWQSGDPTWKGGKGKNIIGALNYLSAKGMNSVYFLTMNVQGDGKDVWPWTGEAERHRFDASKLDQWEAVFSHMDRKGLMLHVVTQETENDQLLDGGNLGVQRKLYYRELVARFGHHLAITWNLGEENTNTDAQRKAFADHIRSLDPYDHPIVIHSNIGDYDNLYTPLLGHPSFEGASLQMGGPSSTHAETVKWVTRSAQNGRKWLVCLDEIGPANDGVLPDANDPSHDAPRKGALWGNLMGGGAGCEWYFGYSYPHSDLTCEDWRSRDAMWNQTRHALDFFRLHLPFHAMSPGDGLVSSGWCLAQSGEAYAVYLSNGGSSNLQIAAGTYTVTWYNPRAGGALQSGNVTSLTGPGTFSIGTPPSETTKDWVALVKRSGGPPPPPPPPPPPGGSSVSSFTLVNADSDGDIGPLTNGATLNLATLPTKNLNVRANTSPATVGSVVFGYDGNSNYRTESAAPYALAGDASGNYNPWTPTIGSHSLSGAPYGGSGGTGTAGTPLTITFTVIDQVQPAGPAVTSFTLMNADTDQPLQDPLQDGAVVDLGAINIRANVTGSPIGSVRFALDGNPNFRTENAAPYALAGDTSGDYAAWTPSVGNHSVTATPFSGSGGTGAAGSPLTVTFTVMDNAGSAALASTASVPADGGGGSGGDGSCGALGIEYLAALPLVFLLRRRSLALMLVIGLSSPAWAQGVYQESGGIVVVEIESAPVVPDWASQTSLAGYTGTSYYTWTGPDLFGSPGSGILRYAFHVSTAGTYLFRIHNRHDFADSTEQNDCFTRMDGGAWVKTFSGTRGQWTWATNHEFDANTKPSAEYALAAGDHVLEFSGRSSGFSIDRFHLYLGSVANPLDTSRPQSSTTPGGGPPPTPGPGGQSVSGLALINADIDQPIAGFDSLNSGAVLNLGTLPTRNLNLRADTNPATVGSVVFSYDGNGAYRTESAAPYAIAGDASGNFNAWTPAVGNHSAGATPYDASGGAGTAGTGLVVTFTVIDDPTTLSTNGTAPPPPAPPGGSPPPPAVTTSNGRDNGNSDGCGLGSTSGSGSGWVLLVAALILVACRRAI